MATTMCEIDGRRPAVASVRIRQNGEERTIAVCEEHLRELQGQSRGAGAVAVRWQEPLRRVLLRLLRRQRPRQPHARRRRWHDHDAPAPPGRADRRHAVLQRRHPPAAPACRAEGDGVGQPGRRLDPPALGRDPGRGCPARAAAGRRRCRRDRGADRRGSRREGAHGRCAVAVAGREGCAVGRLRGVASDRRVVRRARARAARPGPGHRDRGGRAARAIRDQRTRSCAARSSAASRAARRVAARRARQRRSTSTAAISRRRPARGSSIP